MNYIIVSNDIFFSPVYSKLLTWLLVEFFKIGDDKDEKKNGSGFIDLSWMLSWFASLFTNKVKGEFTSPNWAY